MPISVINILRNRILLFLCLTCHSQSKNIPSLWIWRIWLKFNIFNILHTAIICVQISYDKIAILLFFLKFISINFNEIHEYPCFSIWTIMLYCYVLYTMTSLYLIVDHCLTFFYVIVRTCIPYEL